MMWPRRQVVLLTSGSQSRFILIFSVLTFTGYSVNTAAETATGTTFNGRPVYKGKVIFKDDFNDASNFESNWQHTIKIADSPDHEFCVYTSYPLNSYINDGKLTIKPTVLPESFVKTGKLQLNDCTGKAGTRECELEAKSYLILPPVQCARLTTLGSFSFRYGIIEIIAKMPQGDWLVPELWLEPKDKIYGPDYKSGRIKIAMSRGNEDLKLDSKEMGCTYLEFGVVMGNEGNVKSRVGSLKTVEGWHKEMHNYTLIWTPDNLSFLVDGNSQYSLIPFQGIRLSDIMELNRDEYKTWSTGTLLAPFDTEFYISLGLSVGGVRDFPDNCVNNGKAKPWTNFGLKAILNFWKDRSNWQSTWNSDTAALQIQSVKVTAV